MTTPYPFFHCRWWPYGHPSAGDSWVAREIQCLALTRHVPRGQDDIRFRARMPGRLAGARTGLLVVWAVLVTSVAVAHELRLPPRPPDAQAGRTFAESVATLERAAREKRIVAEALQGNVPDFLRQLVPVTLTNSVLGKVRRLTVWVAPDYLAVGSNEDYLLMPLSPGSARQVAEATGCLLPTRRLVDAIHTAAPLKLVPRPIPPSPEMTTMPVFVRHNELVWEQRQAALAACPPGTLVAGHKKDVVASPKLETRPGKVAIYGWHGTNGIPIQPLYLGHADSWVDYSHGIRLVHQTALLDGAEEPLAAILSDPELSMLASDEGAFAKTGQASARAPTNESDARWRPRPHFGELLMDFALEPGVRVHMNAPGGDALGKGQPVHLVLYALPNGNTIEQTAGRRRQPDDDWHFNIQHIGAQMRWLRQHEPDATLVVAYLEAAGLSWPAWARKHGVGAIPAYVDRLCGLFPVEDLVLTLSGHSGGGSFVFGFIDAVDRIPSRVERIAFLDSNYAYNESEGHAAKLVQWLQASPRNHLCVLAYQDHVARLNGRAFVSESGGTWGRSHAMKADLAKTLRFDSEVLDGLQSHTALAGRVKFLLKENPERKILHTVQVERNGFIHSMLTGTPSEGEGYEYLGVRAYEHLIEP